MNYNVTVNGKVYSVSVERTGAAAPAAAAPAPVAAAPAAPVAAPAPAPAAAPAPAPAPPQRAPRWQKFLLAGMGAALVILSVMTGILWSQFQVLTRQTVLSEDYIDSRDRELFQTAECQLSDMEFDFLWYEGDQDLTLDFTLRPVKQLKGWSVVGYTAVIQSRPKPWWLEPEGQPETSAPPPRTEYLTADPKTGKAALTLPRYRGETVRVHVTLREKRTGREVDTGEVFTITPEIELTTSVLTGIQVELDPAPDAYVPQSIVLAIPRSDSRFES